MAFQLVRGLFSRGSPPCSRTRGPTVENAAVEDQRSETNYSLRDVKKSAAESDWSQLARAQQTEIEGRDSHIGASNVGPESSSLPFPSNGHPNTPKDSSSSEDETRQDRMLRKRSKKSLLDEVPSCTTPPNWDDYPEPAPPKPAIPVDANACSTSARIADQPDANVCSANARIPAQPDASVCSTNARTAAQYAEERTSHARWQRNGAAMQVE